MTATERQRLRAVELADEHPRVAIQMHDAARPRSRKTARARTESKWGVGPSDLSSCRRAVQYRERPPDDLVLNEVDKSAAYLGTMVDEGYKRARRRRYPWRRFSTTRKPFHVVIPGIDSPGEPDEYDPIIGRVTDYKTAGAWAWERIGKFGPFPDMWDQALVYGLGLEDAGEKVTEVEVIVVNLSGRENGTTDTFRRRYDRQEALVALARLHAILDGLDAGGDLPRDREGPSVDPICAKFCPFRDYCWQVPAAEAAGRSPESYVLVHDDADVEATLAEYDEGRALESEGKRRKDVARARLDGVERGEYGPYELGWRGGGKKWQPDPAARMRQVEAVAGGLLARVLELEATLAAADMPVEAPTDPGLLARLPYPEKEVYSKPSIHVALVRKAERDRREAEAAQDVDDEAV